MGIYWGAMQIWHPKFVHHYQTHWFSSPLTFYHLGVTWCEHNKRLLIILGWDRQELLTAPHRLILVRSSAYGLMLDIWFVDGYG